MVFDTDISDEGEKIGSTNILGEIIHLHQRTKNSLKHVHKNLKNGNLVVIPYSDNQESFSRAARDKGWVDEILLHPSGGKEENRVAMAQYLSKYLFDKYEDEAIFAAS